MQSPRTSPRVWCPTHAGRGCGGISQSICVAGYLPTARCSTLALVTPILSTRPSARGRVAFDQRADLADYVADGVQAEVGDVTDLSRFASGSFDAVFASNLLEHLEWPQLERCVDEVVRVLKPAGHFIAVQPNFRLNPGHYFDDFTHRTIFTDESLADFFTSRGLEVVHREARFLPLTLKSRLAFGHKLVPLYLRLPYRPLAGQMLIVGQRRPSV